MGKHEIKIPLDDETAKYLTTALNELYDRLDKVMTSSRHGMKKT